MKFGRYFPFFLQDYGDSDDDGNSYFTMALPLSPFRTLLSICVLLKTSVGGVRRPSM
jgi:hypothetical protein